MKKRMMAILLAGIMLFSAGTVLSGCGKTESEISTATQPTVSGEPTATPMSATKEFKEADFTVHGKFLEEINDKLKAELGSQAKTFEFYENLEDEPFSNEYSFVYELKDKDMITGKEGSTRLIFVYMNILGYFMQSVYLETETPQSPNFKAAMEYMEDWAAQGSFKIDKKGKRIYFKEADAGCYVFFGGYYSK